MKLSKVLVYLPEHSDVPRVLLRAIAMAEAAGGSVTIADVVEETSGGGHIPLSPLDPRAIAREHRLECLEEVVRRYERPNLVLGAAVLSGRPAMALSAYAAANRFDVIMKLAQPEDASVGLLGTTATRLLRHAPSLVFILDPRQPERPGRVAVAVGAGTEPEERDLAHDLIDAGQELARLFGAELSILHAWSAFGEELLRSRMRKDELDGYVESARRQAEERLMALVGSHDEALKARCFLVKGDADRAIPEFVAERKVDVLVVGTVGRTGLRGFLLGNTAERLIQRFPCSILAVKPEGAETGIAD